MAASILLSTPHLGTPPPAAQRFRSDDLDEVGEFVARGAGRHSRVVRGRGPLGFEQAWLAGDAVINGNALDTVPVRLAKVLLRLARTEGEPGPQGVSIRVRFTQEQLGDLIGVTRQTTMQHLHDLVARGLIGWRYGRATLLDMAGLQTLAATLPGEP